MLALVVPQRDDHGDEPRLLAPQLAGHLIDLESMLPRERLDPPADNPVIDLEMADFRDPYVFRHDPSDSWVMVVVKSNEQVAEIYRSADLLEWGLASEIEAGDAPGRVWECPTLVELPICGVGRSRRVFKVDALHDAPGVGELYVIGHFDGYRFTRDDEWQAVDAGRDFYAAIAWNGPRDSAARPAWIGAIMPTSISFPNVAGAGQRAFRVAWD